MREILSLNCEEFVSIRLKITELVFRNNLEIGRSLEFKIYGFT